jgi:hypothetical protein
MGRTDKGLRRAWFAEAETLEALAGVLSARWRTAATLARPFWQVPVRWLRAEATAPAAEAPPHHLTMGGRLIR